MRGALKPRKPVISLFTMFGDQQEFMQFVQQVIELHGMLKAGLATLDEKIASVDALKRDPTTITPSAEAVAQEMLKRVAGPTAESVAALLRPYLQEVPKTEDIAAIAAALLPQQKPINLERLARKVSKKIRIKIPAAASHEDLVRGVIEELKAGKHLSVEDMKGFKEGLEQTISPIRRLAEGFRGGGDTVVAGNGITITNTPNGNKQISASNNVGSIYIQKLSPTQVASNITLNLALLDHTAARVLSIIKNGQTLDPSDATFGWSVAGLIVTVLNGFTSDVFLINYSTV